MAHYQSNQRLEDALNAFMEQHQGRLKQTPMVSGKK
jgi:hypothetical protein